MKNIMYKNAILINLKGIEKEDLQKIKINPTLKELSEKEKTSRTVKSLSTFQKIFDHQTEPYHTVNNRYYFFRIKNEKRDIPSSVVNEELEVKVKKFEQETGNKINSKDKKELKEDIVHAMLPKAFIKSSYLDFCIDFKTNCLIANVSSPNKINEIITKIREFTDINFDLNEKNDLSTLMTQWLKSGSANEPFKIEDFVSLEDLSTGGITVYKKDRIENLQEEIESNLEQNKIVKEMRMNWHERIVFTLSDEFIIKSIKSTDTFEEHIEEELGNSKDTINEFDSTMFNFISDIIEIVEDLKKAE